MKVELISHTQYALELLLYTKNTRLDDGYSMQDLMDMSYEDKMEKFSYMLDTIQSSFEFVDYTFKISGVSRVFTHQLVRTRTGSYAQQTQRGVDVRDSGCDYPPETKDLMNHIFETYGNLIDSGMQVQEARDILPGGTHTSIIAKFNLRNLHDMGLVRLCTRTAGIYQEVFKEMKQSIVRIHPWAEKYIKVHCAWYGTCAFPRYTECPVYEHTLNATTPASLNVAKNTCDRVISNVQHVADPGKPK